MDKPLRNASRLAAVGLCVALVGCSSSKPVPGGGATGSKAEKARKDAEALALSAVTGGATAQARELPEIALRRSNYSFFGGHVEIARDTWRTTLHATRPAAPAAPTVPVSAPAPAAPVAKGPPAPKSPLRPGTAALMRERVVSTIAYATEAEAEEDALAQARDLVEQKLAALDPPVRRKPSVGEVKSEFVRKDSRTVRQPDADERAILDLYGMSGNRVYVEYDVEITADQVRELRSLERVSAGMRVLGVLVAVALAGFLFLRADEWTKGYLTRWLAFGAVLLAGGVAAALIFV